MGLFRKGITHTIKIFQRTGLFICSHSREGKTLSYSRILNHHKQHYATIAGPCVYTRINNNFSTYTVDQGNQLIIHAKVVRQLTAVLALSMNVHNSII